MCIAWEICVLLVSSWLGCHGVQNYWVQVGIDLRLHVNVISMVNASTSISCSVECSLNQECRGFDFRPWDGLCSLHDAADATVASVLLQSVYVIEHTTLNFVHQPDTSCDQSISMCVMRVNTISTWNAARKYCQAFGMDLVVLDTADKLAFALASVISSNARVWIGLSDVGEEGNWKWVNGETATANVPWHGTRPEGGIKENCAIYASSDDAVHDIACDRDFPFICEN